MPQGLPIQRICPLRTRRPSHNTPSTVKRCPQGVGYSKNPLCEYTAPAPQHIVRTTRHATTRRLFQICFPWEHSVRPTTRRKDHKTCSHQGAISKMLPLRTQCPSHNTAKWPQDMLPPGGYSKMLPLRTQRPSHNTASAMKMCPKDSTASTMRRCPKECLFKKYFLGEHSVRLTTQRPPWGDAPRNVCSKSTPLEYTAYVPYTASTMRRWPKECLFQKHFP